VPVIFRVACFIQQRAGRRAVLFIGESSAPVAGVRVFKTTHTYMCAAKFPQFATETVAGVLGMALQTSSDVNEAIDVKQRAALHAIFLATAHMSAVERKPIVYELQQRPAWDTLSWLLLHGIGGLQKASRNAEKIVSAPKWGAQQVELFSEQEKLGRRFICASDPEWPTSLNDLGTLAPIGLWVQGTAPDLSSGSLTVAGGTKPSSHTLMRLSRVARSLSSPVIAGLKPGSETYALRYAHNNKQKCVAVLAAGLDVGVRQGDLPFIEQLIRTGDGYLVSETPIGARTTRRRRLDRARITAALGHGVLVTDTKLFGEAMAVAARACKLGRPVGAFTGSQGTDWLIAQRFAGNVNTDSYIDDLSGIGEFFE
jgi:predicted Rossmann fold nucleotide-binding protein DprA/Smf involved in DNA uptake